MKAIIAALFLSLAGVAQASIPAHFGLSPDNSQGMVIGLIDSAKKTLAINIYQFGHPGIRDAVIAAIRRGVTVQMLIEGTPVGGLTKNGHDLIEALLAEMKNAHNPQDTIFVMTAAANSAGQRRFAFDHAKYMVIDYQAVYISSDNFMTNSEANPNRVGDRGWHIAVKDAALASQMLAMFKSDTTGNDILDLRTAALPDSTANPVAMVTAPPRTVPSIPGMGGTVEQVRLITSPDSINGLVQLLRSAKRSIDLEYMNLPFTWKASPNPLVSELAAAAQRGVTVRILLNDDNAFSSSSVEPEKVGKNLQTVCKFLSLSQGTASKKLPVEGRIISTKNVQITYVHNKGIVVDGQTVLVSSINGTQNSIENNREVALAMLSQQAGKYFETAFNFDWTRSPKLDPAQCQ